MSLSKWPPGSHIGFFWFPDSNFSLALNINSRLSSSLFVSVSRSLVIVSYIYIYIVITCRSLLPLSSRWAYPSRSLIYNFSSLWPSNVCLASDAQVSIGTDNCINCLYCTKPLLETILAYPQQDLVTFTSGQFHMKCPTHQSLRIVWKLHIFKLWPHLLGPVSYHMQLSEPIMTKSRGPFY